MDDIEECCGKALLPPPPPPPHPKSANKINKKEKIEIYSVTIGKKKLRKWKYSIGKMVTRRKGGKKKKRERNAHDEITMSKFLNVTEYGVQRREKISGECARY